MAFKKIKDFFSGEAEEEPEVRRLTLDELKKEIIERKEDLKSKAEADLEAPLKRIIKTSDRIGRLIDDLEDAETSEEVHPRIYKSASEEKRLLIKKTRRALKKLEAPSSPTWGRLNKFSQSLSRSMNLLGEASSSHRLRVATLFEGRMKRLGDLLDNLQTASKDFNETLTNTNTRLNELDELSSTLSERDDLLRRSTALEKRIDSLKRRINDKQEALRKTRDSLEGLKKSDQFELLEESKEKRKRIKSKLNRIENSIQSSVSGISRPLRKMKKMIQREEYATSYDVLDALNSYLSDPFEAAKSEEEGLPKLRAMLQELKGLMEGEMKLSDRERRKKLETVEKLLEEHTVSKLLSEYREKKREMIELKEKRTESPLLKRKRELERSLKSTKSNLESTEKNLDEAKERLTKTKEDLAQKTERLRESSKSIFNAEIQLPD